MTLYWLATRYACGGVVVDQRGVIVEACPIYGKWQGQLLSTMLGWLKGKQVFIEIRQAKGKGYDRQS